MAVKQLSVFAENRPGALSAITTVLGDAGVDIHALCIADTTEFGVLRLVVDQVDVARKALTEAGFAVSLTNVLAICVGHKPGGLAEALRALGADIMVEYCYAFIGWDARRAFVILRVDDNDRAAALLQSAGFPPLEGDEIFRRQV